MARYHVTNVRGVDHIKREIGLMTVQKMKRRIDDDLEQGIEDMAERSYEMAPVETGALRASILASVRKLSRHHYIYGSHLPYAQRQEYEHKLLRGYFREAVRMEAPNIERKIESTIRRSLKG